MSGPRTGRFFALLVLSAAAALTAKADWRSIGPFGGAAQGIVVDPNNAELLIAATANGLIYRSKDGGISWSAARFPYQHSLSLHVLAVAPGEDPAYFAGVVDEESAHSGLYRSRDSGQTWQPLVGLRGVSVFSLAISKGDPRLIAAGGRDGVYLSRDGGDTWKRISPQSNGDLQPITSLAIDPSNPAVIYAGTPHLPWRTTDGGLTWSSIHGGMIDDSDVFSIQVDPVNPQRVFASACSGIYRSGNAGMLWTKMMGIPRESRRTYTIRQDPGNPETVFAGTSHGLWKSTDGGGTWREVSTHIVKSLAFDPRGRHRVYLATADAGLLVSRDGAETTQAMNSGFVNRRLPILAGGSRELYTSSIYETGGGGLFRWSLTEKAGAANVWQSLAPEGNVRPGNVLSVVANGSLLFAANYNTVLKSADSGRTWVALPSPWRSSRVTGLRWLPGVPGTLLAATSVGLYRTEDAGHSWKVTPFIAGVTFPVSGLFGGDVSGAPIVAQTSGALFLSADGGTTWSTMTPPDRSLYDLATSPDGTVLAGTWQGLYRSTDSGKTWAPVFNGIGRGTVSFLMFHPTRPLALAVQNGAIFGSEDDGLTWTRVEMQGLETDNVRALTVPAGAPDQVFALTQAEGIFVTTLQTRPAVVSADAGTAIDSPAVSSELSGADRRCAQCSTKSNALDSTGRSNSERSH